MISSPAFRAFRSDDVAAFAVLIEDESDVGGAVRIVFETFNNSGNTVFIALEVDDTVGLLVAAALMTNSDTAEIVTTGSAVLLFTTRAAKGLPLCVPDSQP